MKEKAFRITGRKGFHLTFSNGVTLSVQFGYGNYCENRDFDKSWEDEQKKSLESNTAEIAIWLNDSQNEHFPDRDDKWITKECPHVKSNDDVDGWVTIDRLVKIINWCNDYKRD